MEGDYKVGNCYGCNRDCTNLRWGQVYEERYCSECYKSLSLCDWCKKPHKNLFEYRLFSNSQPYWYCKKCNETHREDDEKREKGWWISRSGLGESFLRRWLIEHRHKEILNALTPERIQVLDEDLDRIRKSK